MALLTELMPSVLKASLEHGLEHPIFKHITMYSHHIAKPTSYVMGLFVTDRHLQNSERHIMADMAQQITNHIFAATIPQIMGLFDGFTYQTYFNATIQETSHRAIFECEQHNIPKSYAIFYPYDFPNNTPPANDVHLHGAPVYSSEYCRQAAIFNDGAIAWGYDSPMEFKTTRDKFRQGWEVAIRFTYSYILKNPAYGIKIGKGD